MIWRWHKCLSCWRWINAPVYFCYRCYLLKEAAYGVYDLENDAHYASESDKQDFRKWAVERLLKFVKHELEAR